EREVVGDDEEVAERHPVAGEQLADGDPRVVHVRLGLREQELQALGAELDRRGRVALAAATGPPGTVRKAVEDHPADVVPGPRVLVAGVPQADDELHERDASLRAAANTANGPGTSSDGALTMVPAAGRDLGVISRAQRWGHSAG